MEVVQQADAEPLVRCVTLSLAKGTVTATEQWEELGLTKALERLEKRLPVVLVVNGRGVLHKQVNPTTSGQETDETLLATVLPAVKAAEFYVQRYRHPHTGFLSLARRDTVDALLTQLQAKGARVIALSFGPFVFGNVWPYIKEELQNWQDVAVSGFRLTLDEKGIVNFHSPAGTENRATEAKVKVGEDELEIDFLLAYAAALAEFTGAAGNLLLQAQPVEACREEHRQQKLFRFSFPVALAFFLCLLLGNFFVFTSQTAKNADLHTRLGHEQNSLNDLKKLEKDAAGKKAFLQATGWLGGGQLSFYADRLAATVPEAIHLKDLAINPLDEQGSKAANKRIFEAGSLAVAGSCSNPVDLNNWIKAVRQLDWVARVDRQNYTYEETKRQGTFSFYIQVKGGR